MVLHVGENLETGYYLDLRSNFGVRSSGIYNQLGSVYPIHAEENQTEKSWKMEDEVIF